MQGNDPIDRIQWFPAAELNPNGWNPNGWNPNRVFDQELVLLERSIIKNGWTQPILINTLKTIIDGFHRWGLSQHSSAIFKIYAGMVPCAVLDVSNAEAMALTVRINRAKGDHMATGMAELCKRLHLQEGWDMQQIAVEIGGTIDEVRTLIEDDIFKARDLANHQYSQAWVPAEANAEGNVPRRGHTFLRGKKRKT